MIIVVMGVAGSGKTTVGTLLAGELGWEFVDADAFHSPDSIEKMRVGHALDDADRAPWLSALSTAIDGWIGEGRDVVLACSALTERYRARLRRKGQVHFVYLKGPFSLIEARMKARPGHFFDPLLLRTQFELMEEPSDALELDIHSSPEALVRVIRERLHLVEEAGKEAAL